MPRWNLRSANAGKDWIRLITYPVMAGIGGLVFLYLTYQSFFYTQYLRISWEEMPINVKDKPLWNVAFLAGFLAVAALLWLAREKCSEGVKKRMEFAAVAFAVIWVLVAGLWWITSADRVPEGDQAFIYGGASYFIEGNYDFFGHGCYCQFYPQQLGQIAVVELFFRIVGTYNYFAIEVACVLFAAGTVLLGYLILRKLGAGFVTKILYCLLMAGCLPLIGYTSWVYGDLPSTFFLFLAFFGILCLQEKPKWYIVAVVVCSFTMACLVRKNSMIFMVAFFILAAIDVISKKRWRMLLTAGLSLAVALLAYQGIYAMYAARSGKEIEKGLPVNSWIAMGMQESWLGYGWYNNYPKETGASLDWDYDAVGETAGAYIRERMQEFKADPAYAKQFYKMKVLSQWNQPLYQCLYFSKNFTEESGPARGSFLDRVYHTEKGLADVLFWADRWHFLIFLGLFLYFVFGVRRSKDPMEYLFAVTILGGFFFTILWEAKARYVLPYYLMAFPLAVLGYARCLGLAGTLWMKVRLQDASGRKETSED